VCTPLCNADSLKRLGGERGESGIVFLSCQSLVLGTVFAGCTSWFEIWACPNMRAICKMAVSCSELMKMMIHQKIYGVRVYTNFQSSPFGQSTHWKLRALFVATFQTCRILVHMQCQMKSPVGRSLVVVLVTCYNITDLICAYIGWIRILYIS
jgi:hypothetical protein